MAGMYSVAKGDPGFPVGLQELDRSPERLWCSGDESLLRVDGWVAVVGTRHPTVLGLDAVRGLVTVLARRCLPLLSGGAMGVDAAAHRAALDLGLPTMAVLAGGLDQPTPARNLPLFQDMIDSGLGILVSERPPGESPRRWSYHRRNRLIAALARAVVVVQAGEGSGALITARAAWELSRPVLVVPGPWADSTWAGSLDLLRDGAVPLASQVDLERAFDLMGLGTIGSAGLGERTPWSPPSDGRDPGDREALGHPDPDEPITRTLGRGPMTIEALAQATGLEVGVLLARLTELELLGRVRSLPGGMFGLAHQ